ncbi:MAG: aminoglycoside phosphotransferase family protein [Chloroflexi bacterium]|nr:aminoglycoside phosphotransferase family protein [Chloroflexota bacterium]
MLGYGRDGEVEYILMTRMPGVAMRHLQVEGQARVDALRELGGTLRGIHDLDPQPFRASGHFPGDEDTQAILMRLERELRRAVQAALEQGDAWTLDISPADAGARARSGLNVIEQTPVPLHSNPGPEHVFLDPNTLGFTGIIDFGDAYLSHPALDFRRWAQPNDRAALMQGYTIDNRLRESFHAQLARDFHHHADAGLVPHFLESYGLCAIGLQSCSHRRARVRTMPRWARAGAGGVRCGA